jgi:hypothetical protein
VTLGLLVAGLYHASVSVSQPRSEAYRATSSNRVTRFGRGVTFKLCRSLTDHFRFNGARLSFDCRVLIMCVRILGCTRSFSPSVHMLAEYRRQSLLPSLSTFSRILLLSARDEHIRGATRSTLHHRRRSNRYRARFRRVRP